MHDFEDLFGVPPVPGARNALPAILYGAAAVLRRRPQRFFAPRARSARCHFAIEGAPTAFGALRPRTLPNPAGAWGQAWLQPREPRGRLNAAIF